MGRQPITARFAAEFARDDAWDARENGAFRAVEMAKEIAALDKEFSFSRIVSNGIDSLLKTPGKEKEIAELMRLAPSEDGGISGLGRDFPEGFSFETLLNSMAEMKKAGINPSTVPMGMLEEWAKSDAEAAHAWSVSNGRVGLEGWGDVLSGVAKTVGQEQASQWFLDKFRQADEEQQQVMSEAFSQIAPGAAARMVAAEAIARQLPPDTAGAFVDQIMERHFSIISADMAEGLSLLNWYPSPEARADVVIRNIGHKNLDKLFEVYPESKLATYGVTRQELEAAIERRKKD